MGLFGQAGNGLSSDTHLMPGPRPTRAPVGPLGHWGETQLKIRALLTAGAAIAAVAGAAITGQGAAAATSAPAAVSASTAKASAHPVPTAVLKSVPGNVTHGKIGGITRTTNTRLGPASGTRARAAGAAAAACAEPECNLAYNGGPIQQTPKVYVVFWGSSWTSDAREQAAEQYLLSFYKGLGPSSETWSTET